MQDDFKEYVILKNGKTYTDRYDNEFICEEDCENLQIKYPDDEWNYREMTRAEISHYENDLFL